MKTLFAVAALAGAMAFTAPAPAEADAYTARGSSEFGATIQLAGGENGLTLEVGKRYRDYVLNQRQIRRSLRHRGFRGITIVRFNPRRTIYVVKAYDRRDRYVRLRVDGYDGSIIDRHFLRGKHGKRYGKGHHQGRWAQFNQRARACLRPLGFRNIHIVDKRRGPIALAEARNRRGRLVEVELNLRTCRILDIDRLGHRGYGKGGKGRGYGKDRHRY